jgi:EKC/KEOPS complex subunit CGI121/TPRKB
LIRNSQIAESFRRFGVTDDTSNLLAIKILSGSELSTAASNVSKHLLDAVDGNVVDFTNDNIAVMSDLLRIKKIYKLPVDSKPTSTRLNGSTPDQDQIQQMEAMILGTMAVKGS